MTEPTRNPSTAERPIEGALWAPKVGTEWTRLEKRIRDADSMSHEELERLRASSLEILARSTPPAAGASSRTGLVLGQVQSGKTMSFTGVTALARDNGFRMVIVITGISVQLLNQSVERLANDLGLNSNPNTGWVHLPIVPDQTTDPNALLRCLRAWEQPSGLAHLRKTVLITVMKNHSNLQNLRNLLQTVSMQFSGGLTGMPTLIIDDEADQASLNTKVRISDLSTVYSRIRDLRRCLPSHTMLQYTATPQAPLLLNIADLLSPDFCKVLDPGADYTGGQAFFLDRRELVRTIPPTEIGSPRNPPASNPDSLQQALRLFLLGVADMIIKPDLETRSMLVHPSVETNGHQVYSEWIRTTLDTWDRILAGEASSLDRKELMAEFAQSYDDLKSTASGIAPFDLLSKHLRDAIGATQPQVVNRANGPATIVQWGNSPAWILIGGMAMDRGFTVRGLTVTYMPRPLAASGPGNADTLQQRARFFGYKRRYLGFCRVFLESNVKDAMTAYVEHESQLRSSLRAFEASGRPLSDWRRRFILDAAMQPTRRNVVDIDWVRRTLGSEPVLLKAPHHDPEHVRHNLALVARLRARAGWATSVGEPHWTEVQTHSVLRGIPLRDLCGAFLMDFRTCSLNDSEALNARLLQFGEMLSDNPNATVDVYLMSEGASSRRARTAAAETNELPYFLQGANPSSVATARGYPGDRELCVNAPAAVQIHILDITDGVGVLHTEVPTLAIFAPGAASRTVVEQPQGSI
jgi:hypothetical protein